MRSELLLVNAWVATDLPSVALARQVNDGSFLTDLIHRCAGQRHHAVNLVAVDFWSYGDVIRTVAELNRGPAP